MTHPYNEPMADGNETTTFSVRATDPTNNEQIACACVGLPMAHAKTAELRMSGFSDVVMSIPEANDNETQP